MEELVQPDGRARRSRSRPCSPSGCGRRCCDPNQLENAILNLCINARDAMPDGGRLTIETANTWLDERGARERDMPPGQYVADLRHRHRDGHVARRGRARLRSVLHHQAAGQGTGLGLSMVYGFAKQSGGQVRIYSEVGQGTTVQLYLPRHHGEAERRKRAQASDQLPRAERGRDGAGRRRRANRAHAGLPKCWRSWATRSIEAADGGVRAEGAAVGRSRSIC